VLVLLSLCLENCMCFPSNSLNLNHYDWRKIDTWSFYPPHIWNDSKLITELNHCIRWTNATEWSQNSRWSHLSPFWRSPSTFANGWVLQLQHRKILWLTPNGLIETTSHLYLDTTYPFKASGKTHLVQQVGGKWPHRLPPCLLVQHFHQRPWHLGEASKWSKIYQLQGGF